MDLYPFAEIQCEFIVKSLNVARYYYALWIPVLKATNFDIIEYPKTKKLQDSKEFSRYLIRGEMEKGTLHFSLYYKEGKWKKEKCLFFSCECKCNAGILVYSVEIGKKKGDSLEEKLKSKLPTFIYHYIKGYFHKHIHHHPSHDSLLHAYFSKQSLSLQNPADKAKIMEYYTSHYLQKFKAYTNNTQSVFVIAKENINSRLYINKGINQLSFLLDEGRSVLGEAEFCQALMRMGASYITKVTRKSVSEEIKRIEELQQQISFSYNLCTASYGIKLGYWGIWFGFFGLLVSSVSLIISLNSSPDYSPVIVRMDSIESARNKQTGRLFQDGQREITDKLDSMDKHLEDIRVKFPISVQK